MTMTKPSKLLLGMMLALISCVFIFTLVNAQQNTAVPPAQVASETPVYAITTQDMPTGMGSQPSASTATPAPIPTFGTSPFGSNMGGMSGMNGTAGMSGIDMGTSCPMMGQMSSGMGMSSTGTSDMSGMSGMSGMGGMSMSTTGMAGMSTMAGASSLYDVDGRFVFWNLNPWWALGWLLVALVLLAVLASAVFGAVTLIRRTRRPASPAGNPQ
jgi:hypothetical protein